MFLPMLAMVILTFVVLGINFYWRFSAVKQRKVSIKYFRAFDGGDAPEYIKTGSRHFSNLFEMPMLFYVAGLVAMIHHVESIYLTSLAWLFVIFRILHAGIHMTYNNVVHRMSVFWGGSLCILGIWLVLASKIVSQS
jgi:hypothetical protein